jgi:hypothetical protein
LTQALIDDFIRSEASIMVAAALHILARMADDEEERNLVVAPWAWSLRQRARQLESEGKASAASQAKVIARMVSAVALGKVTSVQLAAAAATLEVNGNELREAVDVLEQAMRYETSA